MNWKEYGQNLKELVKSPTKTAKEIGISRTTLWRIMNGQKPDAETYLAIENWRGDLDNDFDTRVYLLKMVIRGMEEAEKSVKSKQEYKNLLIKTIHLVQYILEM